jgi:epoxyqueuosine reductase
VVERCRGRGFALAGVAAAAPSGREAEFRAWLAAGKHGSMAWLAEHADVRMDVRRFLPGARSVIMVADQYAARGDVDEEAGAAGGFGRVARYARGRDYHKEMKKRLHGLCDELAAAHPGETFRAFVDTAPVQEREQAARAGLGWIGKHTLLINPRLGSWLLLGGIATTLELVDEAAAPLPEPDHCGTCTRCIDACPTGAISPYSLDASRCISYLTIERREAISEELGGKLAGWIFGCDICQEVCPHNSARPEGTGEARVNEAYTPRRRGFDLLEVLGWKEEDRRRAFESSSMKRAKLEMMKRNSLLAGASSPDARVREAVAVRAREIAADEGESEMVRGMAELI